MQDQQDLIETSGRSRSDGEIDLVEVWRAIICGKWVVLGFTLAFLVLSVLYALSVPNVYKSTVVLAPTDTSGGGLGGLSRQLGGLASLAGVNLGAGGGGSKTAEALEILQSWAFIEEFISEENIAPLVFAVDRWSASDNTIIYDNELYDSESDSWVRVPAKGKMAAPSSWELYKAFSEYMKVTQDSATGFTSLSVEYFSPAVAKQWVDKIVMKINYLVQKRDAIEAERNIEFLRLQIGQTPLAAMQSVFYDLIEEQTKTLMLAKGAQEYVFKTVNSSRVAEIKSNPKRGLICVIGGTLGVLVGVFFGLIYGNKKRRKVV